MSPREQAAEVIRRVMEALIDEPRALIVDITDLPRRANWRATAHINDTGKLVGKDAANIHGICAILAVAGEKIGDMWTFAINDPDPGERRRKPNVEDNPAHNPAADHELLADVLSMMLERPSTIQLSKTSPCGYTFTIRVGSSQDHDRLFNPVEVRRDEVVPIEGLQALFRAIGKQHGVRYHLTTPGRQ